MENDVTVCDNLMMGPLILFCALASVATTSIPPNGVDVTTQSDVVWTDANWANGLFPLRRGRTGPSAFALLLHQLCQPRCPHPL